MTNRLLAVGDIHAPLHDRRAWNLILQMIADLKPQKVWLAGDIGNWGSLARHARARHEVRSFQSDKLGVRSVMRELYSALPSGQVIAQQGNHDLWVDNYLAANAAELEEDGAFDFRSLLQLRKIDHWVPYRSGIHIGKVYYTHDIGHSGRGALRQNLAGAGQCIVTGHTHSAGVLYGSTVKRSPHFALEVGWVGSHKEFDKFPYMSEVKRKDWQHGVGVVEYDKTWQQAWATFVPFVGGKARYGGKEYRG